MTQCNSKRVADRTAPARNSDSRAASAGSECEREQTSVAGGPTGGASPAERISSQDAAWHVCVCNAPPGG
jgi:hypothetical protein